jgi:hypothetical protein
VSDEKYAGFMALEVPTPRAARSAFGTAVLIAVLTHACVGQCGASDSLAAERAHAQTSPPDETTETTLFYDSAADPNVLISEADKQKNAQWLTDLPADERTKIFQTAGQEFVDELPKGMRKVAKSLRGDWGSVLREMHTELMAGGDPKVEVAVSKWEKEKAKTTRSTAAKYSEINAGLITSLKPNLRDEVLATADDEFMDSLPAEFKSEGKRLHGSSVHHTGASHTTPRPTPSYFKTDAHAMYGIICMPGRFVYKLPKDNGVVNHEAVSCRFCPDGKYQPKYSQWTCKHCPSGRWHTTGGTNIETCDRITARPTPSPTLPPTEIPTATPTARPTNPPTKQPTHSPTEAHADGITLDHPPDRRDTYMPEEKVTRPTPAPLQFPRLPARVAYVARAL